MAASLYLIFFVFSPLIYLAVPRGHAVWAIFLGGLALLPPAIYPPSPAAGPFPWWITGLGVPSDVLAGKSWIAPSTALFWALFLDRRRWNGLSFHWADALLALFCLWPVLQDVTMAEQAAPSGPVASAYLFGTWGTAWLLGRLYLRERSDLESFAAVLAAATLMLLPIAIVEGVSTFRLHEALYGPHPFAADGRTRPLGYRPQAFFENGNQYGLWCACAAVAAVWRWRAGQEEGRPASFGRGAIAVLLIAMTLAAQSFGSILLMILGIAAMLFGQRLRFPGRAMSVLAILALLAGALHLSGVIPLRAIAYKTAIGQEVMGALRAVGRGSFAWRIGQDVKTLPALQEHLLTGHGRWDWFRPARTRPWGFAMLLIGQYGLIGLFLLGSAFSASWLRLAGKHPGDVCRLVLVLVPIALIDALLNSFLFFPAIALGGAGLSLLRTDPPPDHANA